MTADPAETAVSDNAKRTFMSAKQVSAYRSKLLRRNIITTTRYGYVTFTHSATRQWLCAKQRHKTG